MPPMSYTAWLKDASIDSLQRMVFLLGVLQESTFPRAKSRVYLYDLIEQHTICSSCSLAAMLGYNEDETELMGKTGFADLIHPDDLERVSDHYQQFTTLVEGEVIGIDYRMRRTDSTWRWLRSQEILFAKAVNGFPLKVLGIVQDITEFKREGSFPINLPDQRKTAPRFVVAGQTVAEYRQVLEQFTDLASSHAS